MDNALERTAGLESSRHAIRWVGLSRAAAISAYFDCCLTSACGRFSAPIKALNACWDGFTGDKLVAVREILSQAGDNVVVEPAYAANTPLCVSPYLRHQVAETFGEGGQRLHAVGAHAGQRPKRLLANRRIAAFQAPNQLSYRAGCVWIDLFDGRRYVNAHVGIRIVFR